MKRIDIFLIAVLIGNVLFIFSPLFYTEYAYTDELVGLWNFGKGNASHTLLQYGRYITEKLAEALFGSITTIRDIRWIRLFAITGWVVSIPAWYLMLKKIMIKEGLPGILAFFAVLYLTCSPPFAISVSWAACFELFLANTAGFVSGYLFYAALRYQDGRYRLSAGFALASLLTGIVSLFTYQNGFGCFLLPCLLQLLAKPRGDRKIMLAIAYYFLVYALYFLLFKLSLQQYGVPSSDRTGLHINVGNKLPFFLARPLNSAFHFTSLFNEQERMSFLFYGLVAAAWFLTSFLQLRSLKLREKAGYFATVFCLLGLVYLPSLVVRENYASNRTLLALDIAVFLLVAQTFLKSVQSQKWRNALVAGLSCLFVLHAWYNFHRQFLQPVVTEYKQVRYFIENNYHEGIDTVGFIRPAENFFEKKYGISRSWDEFGVPSTFFEWTPGYLVRQIVFEKTGNRALADQLIIKSWPGQAAYLQSGYSPAKNSLLIDAEQLMQER